MVDKLSLFIGASQEEAFRSVMDYFTSRRMRILTSNSPSYIRAELGAWVSMFMGNAKGEVEATIVKRDSGSYINLNFSFLKEYLADLILSVVVTFLLYVIPFVVTLGYPSEIVQTAQGWLYMIVTLMAILLFGFALGIAGYNASKTRDKSMQEFNMFIQSLATKKT